MRHITRKTLIDTIYEDCGLPEPVITWGEWKKINEDGFDESEFARCSEGNELLVCRGDLHGDTLVLDAGRAGGGARAAR